jgi:hypothetical protein
VRLSLPTALSTLAVLLAAAALVVAIVAVTDSKETTAPAQEAALFTGAATGAVYNRCVSVLRSKGVSAANAPPACRAMQAGTCVAVVAGLYVGAGPLGTIAAIPICRLIYS